MCITHTQVKQIRIEHCSFLLFFFCSTAVSFLTFRSQVSHTRINAAAKLNNTCVLVSVCYRYIERYETSYAYACIYSSIWMGSSITFYSYFACLTAIRLQMHVTKKYYAIHKTVSVYDSIVVCVCSYISILLLLLLLLKNKARTYGPAIKRISWKAMEQKNKNEKKTRKRKKNTRTIVMTYGRYIMIVNRIGCFIFILFS